MLKKVIGLSCFLMCSALTFASQSIIANKATESLVLDVESLGNSKILAVGERGHVLLSENNGTDWTQVVVPTQATLTALSTVDEQIGFAVGHQQTILKTSDGGKTWSKVYSQEDDLDYPALMDVWFKDASYGIAVGAYGLFLRTSNGGQDWEFVDQTPLEDPDFGLPHFYSLDFDSRTNRLYMAGELGFIAVSEDFGATWNKLDSPYNGSFFSVKVTPKGSLHAMGLRGHLFRSEDQGNTWTEIETNTIASLNSMISVGGSQLVYFGVDGVLLFSKDDGQTVEVKQRVKRDGITSGLVTGINRLVLVGEKGIDITDLDGRHIE